MEKPRTARAKKHPPAKKKNKRALVPARAHSYAGHGRDAAGNNVWTVPAASAAPGSESGAPPLFQRGGPMNSLPGSRYTQKKTTTIYSHVSQPSCRDKRNPRRSDAFQAPPAGHGRSRWRTAYFFTGSGGMSGGKSGSGGIGSGNGLGGKSGGCGAGGRGSGTPPGKVARVAMERPQPVMGDVLKLSENTHARISSTMKTWAAKMITPLTKPL